jgi:hypothetical protein
MFVSTFGAGMSNAMPDVCMTPPLAIPAPFPNIGANAMVVPAYFTIMINCMPELNVSAMYAITSGDEAGAMGGVASGVIMGMGRCLLPSQAVFIAGIPVWRLTAMTIQNLSNAPGTTTVPSQTVKQVMR